MTLLVDVDKLHPSACNHGLESFYKAGSEPPDDSIWGEHPSPFVRRLIELFTERGLKQLTSLQAELAKWLDHEMHKPVEEPRPKPPGMMERWTAGELKLAKLYLESLPPDQFQLEDWMMVVDYLVQRYLPKDTLKSEAEWLAVRSAMMGRVQANLETISASQADKLVSALPVTAVEAKLKFDMDRRQQAVMDFGRARCAEHVTAVADNTRKRLRKLIIDDQEAKMLGNREPHDLKTKLLDDFGELNRDWRRIAVTEAGENCGQGFIASLAPGQKVKRLEHYDNACNFCRKIDGMVFEVVSPDDPNKDDWKHVWVGKTNVGRSASPQKRADGGLVPRLPEELWRPAAGVQHPHCRGWFVLVSEPEPGYDPEFSKWIHSTLSANK